VVEKIISGIYKQKSFNTAVTSQISSIIDSLDIDAYKSNYTVSDLLEKFDDLNHCADIIEVREYSNGDRKIHNANFCSNPHVCAVCASRVANRRKQKFSMVPVEERKDNLRYRLSIQEAAKRYDYCYMLTATIKSGVDLNTQIDLLQSAVRSFQRMGQKRKKNNSPGEWGKVRAALGNVENKRGSGSGEWHTHVHFLVFSDDKIDYTVYDSDKKKKILETARKEKRQATKEELYPAAIETICHICCVAIT